MTTELFFKVKLNQKFNRKSKYFPSIMDQMDKNRLGTLCSGHKMDENGSKEFFKWKLMSKTYTTYYGHKWII